MAWVQKNENAGTGEAKNPWWAYKQDVDIATIKDGETRDFLLLTGADDPTATWPHPVVAWMHNFRTARGNQTTICTKFKVICPLCIDNELFKQQNPNYKAQNLKLPRGLGTKVMVQVWDVKYRRVMWLMAGKDIQDGVDFILTRMGESFNNKVSISRKGAGIQAKYRVDAGTFPDLTPEDKAIVAAQIKPMSYYEDYVAKFDPKFFFDKTGLNAAAHIRAHMNQVQADISGWGMMPPDIEVVGQQVGAGVVAAPQPVAPQPAPSAPVEPVSNEPLTLDGVLNYTLAEGVFAGKTMREALKLGKVPYMKYMAQTANTKEGRYAQFVLDNLEAAMAQG